MIRHEPSKHLARWPWVHRRASWSPVEGLDVGKELIGCYAVVRGPNYIEVDVDVGSSRSAANVVGLVQGALKSLVIDLAVLLEGHCTVSSVSQCTPAHDEHARRSSHLFLLHACWS